VFAGAQPRVVANHHFGIAVCDSESQSEFVRNVCERNMLGGILLCAQAGALLLDKVCRFNCQWGVVLTPDAKPNPAQIELRAMNRFDEKLRGAIIATEQLLTDIGG